MVRWASFAARRAPRVRGRYKEIETQEQILVAAHLRKLGVLFTISTGGVRVPMRTAAQMKAMGYQAGTPDILILEPRGLSHGLLIEMKRPKIEGVCERGATSPEQKDFIDRARKNCFAAIVCYGSEDAIFEIEAYLKMGVMQER